MNNSQIILEDLDFVSEITTAKQESLFGGVSYDPKTPDAYGTYQIPKDKYNCYEYYEPKWGGKFVKCYIDGKAPKGDKDPDNGRGANGADGGTLIT